MSRRNLTGRVVGKSGNKTVIVRVERRVMHELYKKTMRRTKKYHVHDESNSAQVGDMIRIRECAPVSKLKTWEVVEQISKG